ncbi:DUF7269 family protein [Haloferax larsenii]|uniref:Uncharacterized protein n=1 Tax=Haloferax larsenii TaxID=302484 RepID=A0A1H7GAW6_HALLR|nr:hypothetical protein [Haloferax larsenii]SEK35261.1 hypothetical protein SAMN04488691_101264 [Haloferax larsenii]
MISRRSFAVLVGVAATVAGLAVVVGVRLGLGLTDVFLALVAALATIQGLRYVQRRRETTVRTTQTSDPEVRVAVPVPGSDFDDQLVAATSRRTRWSARDNINDRLETAARRALILRDGRTPDEADTLIETGAWTDDVVAARFLGADIPISFRQRLRFFISGQTVLTSRVARTVDAIDRIGRDSRPGRDTMRATDHERTRRLDAEVGR